MKTARAHDASSSVPIALSSPRPVLTAVPAGREASPESLSERIARLISDAGVLALPPGAHAALWPAPPESETFLCFLATSRSADPWSPRG